MTVFTDGVHLISDTSLDELHAFAKFMGLKRVWFQSNSRHPHYDLTTWRARCRAIIKGAVPTNSRVIVERCIRL